jgi:hypothetical protein
MAWQLAEGLSGATWGSNGNLTSMELPATGCSFGIERSVFVSFSIRADVVTLDFIQFD